jgi:hypothetical protein
LPLNFRHSHLNSSSQPYFSQCVVVVAPNTNFAPNAKTSLAFSTLLDWDVLPTSFRSSGYFAVLCGGEACGPYVPSPPLPGGVYELLIGPPADTTGLLTTLAIGRFGAFLSASYIAGSYIAGF